MKIINSAFLPAGTDQLPMDQMDQQVTACGDGNLADESFCCGNREEARACCEAGLGVRIVDGQVVTTTSAVGITPTQSPSASPSATNSGNASSNAGTIGGAVGGGAAAIMIIGLIWFIWHRRRKAAKAGSASNTATMAELNSDTRKDFNPQTSPPPGYSRPPSELPTAIPQRPVELAGDYLPQRAAS